MKRLFITVLILCWSALAQAEMPGASFFKSLMGGSGTGDSGSSSGSAGQGDDSAGSQGSDDSAGSSRQDIVANDFDVAWGGKTAGAFLSQLPAVPGTGCEDNKETIEKFYGRFGPVAKELGDNVAVRRRAMKKWNEKNSKKMMENAVDMPGFEGKSQDEMKKMSKAERKRMAEKMMEDKYGVSMQDLKNQKKAQREGKTMANVDFAKSMAGEQQANDLMKSKGQVEADKKKVANAGKLAKEQDKLAKEVLGLRGKFNNKVVELEKDKTGLSMKKDIEREQKVLEEMQRDGKSTCKDYDAQHELIVDKQKAYCSFMSPRYLKILHEYRIAILGALPKHDRLDQVASEIQKNQTGVGLSNASKGLNGLETVHDYVKLLGGSYTYNLGARDKEHPTSYCDGEAGTVSQ